MSARRIDAAVSRMMFARTAGRTLPEFPGVDRNPLRRDPCLSGSPTWIHSGLLDKGLDSARRFAEFAGTRSKHRDTRAVWLELSNKITAFRLFQGHGPDGRPPNSNAVTGFDVYRRLFAAEGWSYRNARPGMAVGELSLPAFSPVSVHAGVGLRLAEPALARIHAGESKEVVLTEFLSACRRDAVEGCAGIMEEELGLLARTLYPHLMAGIDAQLENMDETARDRFWHGAGRGIYFAPGNLPPFRSAPWRGLGMCASEPRHEAGRRNAISGFCFALAMVNLLRPEILDLLFEHHSAQAFSCMNGIRAVIAVWHISGGDRQTLQRIADYEPATYTARVLWPLLWPGSAEDEDHRRPERMFSVRRSA